MRRLESIFGKAGLCGFFTLKKNTMSNFVEKPTTMEEFQDNVQFQLDNVKGWLSVNDYQSALITAQCLVEALKKIVVAEESEQIALQSHSA